MSEQARSGGDGGTAPADLPYVDGRDMSPAQLRAEVAKKSDPQIQNIEEVRDELVGVVDERGSPRRPTLVGQSHLTRGGAWSLPRECSY